jgi:hypothetical protein
MKFLFIAPPYRAPTRIAQYKIERRAVAMPS